MTVLSLKSVVNHPKWSLGNRITMITVYYSGGVLAIIFLLVIGVLSSCMPLKEDTVTTVSGGNNSVPATSSNLTSIHAGDSHTCALLSDKTIECWGNNSNGQLGDGSTTNRMTPVNVSSISNATAIGGGGTFTCALLSNSTLQCWGNNRNGQLGDGSTTNRMTPVNVSSISNATAIGGGEYYSCALLSNSTVQCWGNNSSGQLGDGSTTNKANPVTVSGISNATAISVNDRHACALLSNKTIKCWGENDYGQLGDGSKIDRTTPVTVSGISTATAVIGGNFHTCAMLSNNSIKCWGDNGNGQLGDGSNTQRTTPVSVLDISTASNIASSGNHNCVLLSDSTIKCWGHNYAGQLGDGTTTNMSRPVTVPESEISSASKITVGENHSCALLSDSTIKCWGQNNAGQLGDGTTTNRTVPVLVSGYLPVNQGNSNTTTTFSSSWTQQLGTSENDGGLGITSDSSGNVYVTGYTYGSLDGNTSAGRRDLFVVKYYSSGVKQWTQQLGTSDWDYGYGITSDSSGNVYVTGRTGGGLDGNTNAGGRDLFVVKYNSSGVKQWTQQFGSSGGESGSSITSDSSGNLYVTGYTTGDLDGNTIAGILDLFVVKYNSSGVKQWTQQLGTSSSDEGRGITSDSSGNIYVTGDTGGGLDGNTHAGSADLFVVKYSSSGVKQWTQQLGTSGQDYGYGITSDSSSNLYVTGYTTGGLDGNTSAGNDDLFVVKYNSSGVKQWTRQLGTSTSDYGYGITSDSSGNVYVTGYTSGGLDGNTSAGGVDFFIVKYDTNGNKQ